MAPSSRCIRKGLCPLHHFGDELLSTCPRATLTVHCLEDQRCIQCRRILVLPVAIYTRLSDSSKSRTSLYEPLLRRRASTVYLFAKGCCSARRPTLARDLGWQHVALIAPNTFPCIRMRAKRHRPSQERSRPSPTLAPAAGIEEFCRSQPALLTPHSASYPHHITLQTSPTIRCPLCVARLATDTVRRSVFLTE